MTVRAVVIGAGGYAGAELIGLLLRHPDVEVVGLFASSKHGEQAPAQRFDELFPRWRGATGLAIEPANLREIDALDPHVVFLATPHEVSHDLAPELLTDSGERLVIDLSAAFRFKDHQLFRQHYGFAHQHPHWLKGAVYGLPEVNRDELRSADLIAVPGCYPTSAILPLHPLVQAGAIATGWRPIIDSTSGVSGAGRAPALKSSFCEVSLQPYNVLSHRHTPEIAEHAGTEVIFTPHLGAFDRGILSTIHVKLADGWAIAMVSDALHGAYRDDPFIRLLPAGQWPSVAAVERTNFCDLGWSVDDRVHHLIIVSAIDNLMKGAAGQAVQCMNIRLGISESTGLEHTGVKRQQEVSCLPQLS